MIARLVLIYFVIFCSFLKSSATIFSGYAVRTNGDTLHGRFPDYMQWQYNPHSVSFTDTITNSDVPLTPKEFSMFSVDGNDKYISYTGTRMINPIKLQDLTPTANIVGNKYDSISTFLRFIGETRGVEFYIFSNKERYNIYAKADGEPISELLFKYVVGQVANSSGRYNQASYAVPYYRQQLFNIFTTRVDSSVIASAIRKLNYNESSFLKFIDRLSPQVHEIEKDPIAGFILKAGISNNSIESRNDYLINVDFERSNSSLFGIGYLASGKRLFKHFIYLAQVKVYGFNNLGLKVESDRVTKIWIRSDYIIAPSFNFGYKIVRKENVKILLSPGLNGLLLKKCRIEREMETNWGYSYNYTVEGTEISASVNLSIDIYLMNRYILWASYNGPSQVVEGVAANHSSIQAGVGIKLF